MKIKIIFLGTGSSIPTKTRNHVSIWLSYKDENILIDCGEGTQRQIRISNLNPCKITRLLLTHLHGDHVFGIPGLIHTLSLNNYTKTLYIYGPQGTKNFIKKILELFTEKEKIKTEIKEVNGKFLETEDFKISAIRLEHNTPCNGYIFEEKNKIRINKEKLKKLKIPNTPEIKKLLKGKDIKINNITLKAKELTYLQKGKKISFIFDTKACPNSIKLAKNSDLTIAEATFSFKENKDLAKKYFHLTAEEAARIAKKGKSKKLILIHLSQRYEYKEDLILKEAKKIFPNTEIAKDFLKIEI